MANVIPILRKALETQMGDKKKNTKKGKMTDGGQGQQRKII